MNTREVKEGQQGQGIGEKIAYQFASTPWASTPVVTSVKAYDITDGGRTDVSTTVLSGSASVVGDLITLPILQSLTVNKVYRIEVTFTSGGLTFIPWFVVNAEY